MHTKGEKMSEVTLFIWFFAGGILGWGVGFVTCRIINNIDLQAHEGGKDE